MEYIKVVYSVSGNGFVLSKKALNLFKSKCLADNIDPNIDLLYQCSYTQRHNKYLVTVIEELGELAHGRNGKFEVKLIPKLFEDFYEIISTDGWEHITVNAVDYLTEKYQYSDHDDFKVMLKLLKEYE